MRFYSCLYKTNFNKIKYFSNNILIVFGNTYVYEQSIFSYKISIKKIYFRINRCPFKFRVENVYIENKIEKYRCLLFCISFFIILRRYCCLNFVKLTYLNKLVYLSCLSIASLYLNKQSLIRQYIFV